MVRLTVERYDNLQKYHACRDKRGIMHWVDLLGGTLLDAEPESLVGKTIECNHLIPFFEIASKPRLVEDEK